jgi:hypothetical protein
MPVNFIEIRQQIIEMGRQAPERAARLQQLRLLAANLLNQYARQRDALCRRVEQAAALNKNLRCAIPLEESLDQSTPAPNILQPHVLLAADGSQVNPSRHDSVEFGVINIGAIRMQPGQAVTPSETTRSQLLYDDLLEASDGALTEEIVALRRDLGERRLLAELVEAETLPVAALTDGPLELYREPKERAEYQRLFNEYREVLGSLASFNTAAAGYVDKPKSRLVVQTLELMQLKDDELAQAGRKPLFRGVSDTDLFTPHLDPGDRSPLFAIQSSSAGQFADQHKPHFFYLNTGSANRPHLARVEVPAWVAFNESLLNLLHGTLVMQCRQLGSRPYPYALHRAHEIAVVSYDEKQKLEDMITSELLRNGVSVGEKSYKQSAKDTTGSRTRYK